ncbi:3-phosphoserine/phosphohydroxythreonine transaminase [Salinibacter altiplanensis]|uniref:3-phosphoserine/phosphohydroxythreonine transaminase n=1 Tax=Salinibacter altiplanensis TaxID=1803181 RepID=UPI000C9FF4DE|nr:3-phosphoserine/phosphohydroxythreonine transaminase [Salinibacter altiplanensis]
MSASDAAAPADRSQRQYNFSAGPATLPVEALREVKDELPVYDHVGASVMEISHRSPAYDEIEASAREHLRALLGLDRDWHILFLQGGARMQFYQVPLNFLPADGVADYVVSGRWGVKAVAEAERVGGVNVAASSENADFSYVPDVADWDLTPDASYVHITTNETVNGNQITDDPVLDVPVVTDASSEFLSRPMDLEGYGLIYAGAQKNVGPAGVTVVLVHDDFLQRRTQPLPTMLDYGTHAERRYNTPPVFAIYMVEKVCRWLRNQGGIDAIHAINRRKAGMLYDAIDATDFYQGTVQSDDRSTMNATFRLRDPDLEPVFLKQAEQEGLLSLSGHRSVGGVRASMYNAMPEEGVRRLVQFMDEFERTHG